jgi:hypothetical protein
MCGFFEDLSFFVPARMVAASFCKLWKGLGTKDRADNRTGRELGIRLDAPKKSDIFMDFFEKYD